MIQSSMPPNTNIIRRTLLEDIQREQMNGILREDFVQWLPRERCEIQYEYGVQISEVQCCEKNKWCVLKILITCTSTCTTSIRDTVQVNTTLCYYCAAYFLHNFPQCATYTSTVLLSYIQVYRLSLTKLTAYKNQVTVRVRVQ